MMHLIAALRRQHSRGTIDGSAGDAVAVIAPTGMAAWNIGGSTLHSYTGIGIKARPVESIVTSLRQSKGKAPYYDRWVNGKVWLLDEGTPSA